MLLFIPHIKFLEGVLDYRKSLKNVPQLIEDREWVINTLNAYMHVYRVFKYIIMFFSITPSWAVLIALWATWVRFIGPGPLWEVSLFKQSLTTTSQ